MFTSNVHTQCTVPVVTLLTSNMNPYRIGVELHVLTTARHQKRKCAPYATMQHFKKHNSCNLPMDPSSTTGKNTTIPTIVARETNSNCGGGIAAVASRIQERALQLAKEQKALQCAQEELKNLHVQHAEANQLYRTIHQGYLESLIQLHSVELECGMAQQSIADYTKKTSKVKQQTKEILQELQLDQKTWEDTIQKQIVQHSVRQELYQKHLQNAIQASRNTTARRKEMVTQIGQWTEQYDCDRKATIEEQQHLQEEISRMTQVEEETNKQVESLASQVRLALAKVSLSAPIHTDSRFLDLQYANTHKHTFRHPVDKFLSFSTSFISFLILWIYSVASCGIHCAMVNKPTNRHMLTLMI